MLTSRKGAQYTKSSNSKRSLKSKSRSFGVQFAVLSGNNPLTHPPNPLSPFLPRFPCPFPLPFPTNALIMTTQISKIARHFKVWFQDNQSRVCRGCGEKTNQYELLATSNFKEWFHDQCFHPPEFIRLDKSNSNVKVKMKDNLFRAKNRMEAHNAKVRLGGLQVFNMKAFHQKFEFAGKPVRTEKALKVAFQFLKSYEVAGKVALVCRQWYTLSWNDKLWKRLLDKLPPIASAAPSQLPPKLRYISISKFLCFQCDKFLREEDVGLICPFYKRALCILCRNLDRLKLVSVAEFCRIHKLKASFGKSQFSMDGVKLNNEPYGYLHFLMEKLLRLRVTHREMVIQKLVSQHNASQALVKEIRTLPLEKEPDDIEVVTSKYGPLFTYILELQSPGLLTRALQCLQGAIKCRQKGKDKGG